MLSQPGFRADAPPLSLPGRIGRGGGLEIFGPPRQLSFNFPDSLAGGNRLLLSPVSLVGHRQQRVEINRFPG